jgi:predicted PurR-regulated permease PerM
MTGIEGQMGPRVFWIVLVLFGFFFLWGLSAILLPFVLGMAIAYFLDPLVDWLELKKLSRAGGTAIVILLFFSMICLVLMLFVPLIENQIVNFASRVPALTAGLRDRLDALVIRLQVQAGIPMADVASLKEAAQGEAGRVLSWFGTILTGVFHGGLAFVNVLSLIFVTPVVAFYLLRDWDLMVARIDTWLPRNHAATIRAQASEINRTLSGFARGQAILCLIMAVFYAIALSLDGLQFGLVIGLVTGLLVFIPFVGTLVGAITSITLALMQFDSWPPTLIIGGIFALGSILEGYVLQPLLVGDRVGLHPVWVIFALLAGGVVFGFVGILLAVPVTAVIGVLCRFGLSRYLASPLYAPPGFETGQDIALTPKEPV